MIEEILLDSPFMLRAMVLWQDSFFAGVWLERNSRIFRGVDFVMRFWRR